MVNGQMIINTALRNLIIKRRAYPIEFFIGNLLSCFYLVLGSFFIYNMVYKGNISKQFIDFTGTSDYMSYIILGALIQLFVISTFLNVSRSFITEMREGTLEVLLISPMKPTAYLIGNMLEQILTTTGEVGIAIIISIPFGLKLSNINILSTLLVIGVSLFSFFGLAVLLGGIMILLRDTFIIQNTTFILINLLCGVAFPVQFLPRWLQFISNLLPTTHSLQILRASVISGSGIYEQLTSFLILFLLGTFYILIGLLVINGTLKNAVSNQYI